MVEILKFEEQVCRNLQLPPQTTRLESVYKYENGIIHPYKEYDYDINTNILHLGEMNHYIVAYVVVVDENKLFGRCI